MRSCPPPSRDRARRFSSSWSLDLVDECEGSDMSWFAFDWVLVVVELLYMSEIDRVPSFSAAGIDHRCRKHS